MRRMVEPSYVKKQVKYRYFIFSENPEILGNMIGFR